MERKYLRIYRKTRGAFGVMVDREMSIEVVVLERRKGKFGRQEIKITPQAGFGEWWIDERSIYEASEG